MAHGNNWECLNVNELKKLKKLANRGRIGGLMVQRNGDIIPIAQTADHDNIGVSCWKFFNNHYFPGINVSFPEMNDAFSGINDLFSWE